MKLATVVDNINSRDGQLVVVSRDLKTAVKTTEIAKTMQEAIDNWNVVEPQLRKVAEDLEKGVLENTFGFSTAHVMSPIPRAYHWVDGSAYVTHVELVRKARGAELPASFWTDPLVYMGASDAFIGPNDDILVENEEWGIDFEAEVAVITDDIPAGTKTEQAQKHIKLVMLVNDVTLRNLIPNELGKQFGFYQSKPWTSFSPVAVTPDELGASWDGAKVHLPLTSTLNETKIGSPNAGIDMTFDFARLIEHVSKTRSLTAGTIIGSGTVANNGSPDGSSCLAEVRCLETIQNGAPETPYMKFGDTIEIEMLDQEGNSVFGKIKQKVVQYFPG
ncbi:fumarylacetoacetate hydrolase family protein [Chryseobacterium sp. BIGb0232]|uniref:fumarylacetoacetate hydrolase family protein n=1 Tax=Chryseobacterium sp. BIGb0232 TaxID=2940598 RepID=UPI000F47CB2D|nr:fumarylacetoacetate hydrolase family protein [Chryseobacterium sp. BIGb0232]MCS4301872.1 fumarylacetoacetate (FAA) hydrolase [Chryseobacterium sp. BIGb0232]ROS17819.1 fumarylacetoacetate (FAA) hydrolase [Chryseobacterium nakagawai]